MRGEKSTRRKHSISSGAQPQQQFASGLFFITPVRGKQLLEPPAFR